MPGMGGHLIFILYLTSAASSSLALHQAGNAEVYMAINALAGVDEFDNIYKRRIEIDWSGDEVRRGLSGWSSDLQECCRCWRGTEL